MTPRLGVAADDASELPGIPPRVRTRTGLLHPIAHYVAVYGSQERTIKLWMKEGKDAQDPCPLDDPEALVEWWRRRKKWSVPDRLLAAAADVQAAREVARVPAVEVVPEVPAQAVEPPAAAVNPPAAPAGAMRTTIDVSAIEGFTYEQVVEQLRKTAAVASLEYSRAMNSPDSSETLLSMRLKQLQTTAEQLRKAEKDLAELQRERGDMIPRSDWERDALELLRMLRGQHERMADRIAERVPAEVREVVRRAVLEVRAEEETIFRNLGNRPDLLEAA